MGDTANLLEIARKAGYAAGSSAFEQRFFTHLSELAPAAVEKVRDAATKDCGEKLTKIIEQIPEGPERARLLVKVRRLLNQERIVIEGDRAFKEKRIEHLRSGIDCIEKIMEWADADLALQKPVGTMIHAFQEALSNGRVYNLPSKDSMVTAEEAAAWGDMASCASVFMVQHNWGDAFKNARDYIGGDVRLPDDLCAFEFRINDRHVIAFSTDADGVLYLQHAVQVKKGWLLLPVTTSAECEDFGFLTKLTNEQVRAIAIALDAEIATTSLVRAPHKLNHARERAGKLPLVSYHVVSLAHRVRATPLSRSEHEPAYRVRLHFRRGHWRHFSAHKTWIKWMLVGNPELGFVDKEYRL